MTETTEAFLQKLPSLKGHELRALYIEIFEEHPHSHRHNWLRRRIAWGYQAKLETDQTRLPTAIIDFAVKNADVACLRSTTPASTYLPKKSSKQAEKESDTPATVTPNRDPRIPKPGTVLERDFKGTRVSIKVLQHGFEWNGTVFSSFSKAVKTATGTSYSPFTFFKLGPKPKA